MPNLRVVRSDGTVEPWNRDRIINTLIAETRLSSELHGIDPCPRQLAETITDKVEADLDCLDMVGGHVSSHLIRELVCHVLRTRGMDVWADVCGRVGMSVYDACQIDIGNGKAAHDNANQLNPPEKGHKDKADIITKQQNLALFPPYIRALHLSGDLHVHDLEYFRTRIFCQDYDLRWLFYYGLVPSGNPATSAVASPAMNAEVAILQAVKLMGAGQTNCAGGQGFYNFLTFLSPYLRGLDYREIKQLMQMLVYELMQMYVARGGQSLIYNEPIITRDKNGVNIAPIGELCHRYLNGAGSVAVNDDIEVMSLNKSTGEFEWKPLTAVHVHVPATPIVRTVLKDGRHVTTTSDHSLFTLTSDARFVETSPASDPDHIITAYELPVYDCTDIDPNLAFLTGVCIGDGSLSTNNDVENSTMQIYLSDQAVRDRVDSILVKIGKPAVNWHDEERGHKGKHGRFSTIGIPYLTEIGNGAPQKKVPVEILTASDDVLVELLNGLLSTDGNVSRNRYEFTTTSETLASQVQFVALRLGLQFNVARRVTESNFKRNYPVIRIQFNAVSSRLIKVTNSTRQLDYSKPVGSDQTNHDFSIIRQALSDESDVPLWKESNAFRAKCNRIKHEHLDLIAEHAPVAYRKVKNVLPMEVKSITRLDTPEYVYDVSVADNENFVLANGIVAHNTIFSSLQLSPGVPKIWRDRHPVYMGEVHVDETYGMFEREVRLAFRALMEVMIEGDSEGKPFAFPKPEISLEPCFLDRDDWVQVFDGANPQLSRYDELYGLAAYLAAKFGTPYFDNQIPAYRGAGNGISCYQCIPGFETVYVQTANGLKLMPIEDVGTDDEILTPTGPSKFDDMLIREFHGDLNKVTLVSGRTVYMTDAHELNVLRDGDSVKIRAGDLRRSDKLKVSTRLPADGESLYEAMRIFGADPSQVNEFAYFMGLYCAEGNVLIRPTRTGGHRMQISLNIAEENFYKHAVDILVRVFHVTPKVKILRNERRILVYSKEFCEMFNATGIPEKTSSGWVPDFMFTAPNEAKWWFLHGYYDGDGSFSYIRQYPRINIYAKSDDLAYGLSYLFQSIGISPTISCSHRGLNQLTIATADGIKRFDDPDTIAIDDSIVYTIRELDRVPYDGNVYDPVNVDGHEFVTGQGIVIGNCCAYNFSKTIEDDPDFEAKLNFDRGQHFSMGSMMVVSLNLPRIGYKSYCSLDNAISWAKTLMEYCCDVFEIKRLAIKRVVELGRLPFLSQNPRDCVGDILPHGQLVDFDGLVYTIGLVGLDDMIAAITGSRMHESPVSLRVGLQFVAELQAYAGKLSERTGFEIALARTPAETTAQRFATLDLFNDDPMIRKGAMQYVQGDILKAIELHAQGVNDLPIYYTNGTHVPPAADVDLATRIDQEQKFFPVLDGGNIMHIWLGEAWSNSEGIYDFIMNLARNTQTGYFAFTKDFTVCTDCGYMTPGLTNRCDRCGSASVDHMSRITGYMSAVSGWNAGKRQELRDRQRVAGLPVIESGGRK